jgi:hypothetical protein
MDTKDDEQKVKGIVDEIRDKLQNVGEEIKERVLERLCKDRNKPDNELPDSGGTPQPKR